MDFAKLAPGAASQYPFALPELPYAFNALGAAIDEQTMQIHHGRHHKAFVDNLNNALKNRADLHGITIVDLLANLEVLPTELRTVLRNSGGGYINHCMFWRMMSPQGGQQPAGNLATALKRDFGSFEAFKEKFAKSALTLFGSGWVWLVANGAGELSLMQTHNQDPPLASGKRPVLGVDLWEHAYYLRYQNKRAEYVENFWQVVNWEQCAENFAG
ncbi:MAG: superoxide dismutase [bacterium]